MHYFWQYLKKTTTIKQNRRPCLSDLCWSLWGWNEAKNDRMCASHPLHVQCVCSVCSAESIEANVESTEAHVQSGTEQLARAADYQVNLDKTENMKKRRGGCRREQRRKGVLNVREVRLWQVNEKQPQISLWLSSMRAYMTPPPPAQRPVCATKLSVSLFWWIRLWERGVKLKEKAESQADLIHWVAVNHSFRQFKWTSVS